VVIDGKDQRSTSIAHTSIEHYYRSLTSAHHVLLPALFLQIAADHRIGDVTNPTPSSPE